MRRQTQVEAQAPHFPRTATQLLDEAERLLGAGYHSGNYTWRLITGRHPRAIAVAVAMAEQAISDTESASDSVAVQIQSLMRASELLDRAGEDARVVLACQRVLRLAPTHAHASFNAARALRRLGLLTQAEAVLERALAEHPHDSDLLRLQAELVRLQGRHEQAVTLLRQALPSAPEDGVAWYTLCITLLHLQRYQEALEAAERAIALETPPEVADAWTNKGLALKELGDDMGAITAFRQAIRVFGGQAQARAELAQLYRRRGQRFRSWIEQQLARLARSIQQAQGRRIAWLRQEQLCVLKDWSVNDMGPSLL